MAELQYAAIRAVQMGMLPNLFQVLVQLHTSLI